MLRIFISAIHFLNETPSATLHVYIHHRVEATKFQKIRMKTQTHNLKTFITDKYIHRSIERNDADKEIEKHSK